MRVFVHYRIQTVRMYIDGMNLQRIARHLGVNHQSVSNWVKAYAAQLPPAPLSDEVETIEMDELLTFVGEKKPGLHHHLRRPPDAVYRQLGS
jgi:transposase-like protein